MENIKKAFGDDAWTDYIILVEKHELGEIEDKQFEAQEQRLFQTPSIPGLSGKIRKLVVRQMVDPEETE